MKLVYGSKNCSKCKVLVDKLKAEGVEHEYIDVDTLSKKELETLVDLAGTMSLPIVIG
jgi:arsenate reductase-like glutaredoxin family protein